MANRLWWGYRNGGKFKVFPYHPATGQSDTINSAENSTYDVFYPFEARNEAEALRMIERSYLMKCGECVE
jgi:hypothetical protein